jgi:hypothetical protein
MTNWKAFVKEALTHGFCKPFLSKRKDGNKFVENEGINKKLCQKSGQLVSIFFLAHNGCLGKNMPKLLCYYPRLANKTCVEAKKIGKQFQAIKKEGLFFSFVP